MSITLEVLTEGDQVVVVKRADAADADRLRDEAGRLAAARHPGVVQLVASAPTPLGWEIRTNHAGRTLEAAGPLDAAEVAGLAASLAATLADLHAAGVVHSRLDASHVLIGPHGRPVLCGFGSGDTGGEPSDDVAGLGALLGYLLGDEADAEPIPDRRWFRRQGWSGWERRALLTLADQACAEPATRRPTARRLAAAISEAVPGATISSTPNEVDRDTAPSPMADPLDALRSSASAPSARHPVRIPSVLLAAAGVAALVIGLSRPDGHATVAPNPSTPPDDIVPTMPTTTTTTTTTAPATCGPVGGVDLDGDGCREPVSVDGVVVRVGDRRFQVGDEGDRLVVRDWDCDGQATPALLRPSTGEVYVFPRWDAEHRLVVEPIATVVGAVELVVDPLSEPCSRLSVRTASDELIEIVRGGV